MGIRVSRKEKDVKNKVFSGNKFSDEDLKRLRVIEEGKRAKEKIKTDFIWGRI